MENRNVPWSSGPIPPHNQTQVALKICNRGAINRTEVSLKKTKNIFEILQILTFPCTSNHFKEIIKLWSYVTCNTNNYYVVTFACFHAPSIAFVWTTSTVPSSQV